MRVEIRSQGPHATDELLSSRIGESFLITKRIEAHYIKNIDYGQLTSCNYSTRAGFGIIEPAMGSTSIRNGPSDPRHEGRRICSRISNLMPLAQNGK